MGAGRPCSDAAVAAEADEGKKMGLGGGGEKGIGPSASGMTLLSL
jgi:hypothetical protein